MIHVTFLDDCFPGYPDHDVKESCRRKVDFYVVLFLILGGVVYSFRGELTLPDRLSSHIAPIAPAGLSGFISLVRQGLRGQQSEIALRMEADLAVPVEPVGKVNAMTPRFSVPAFRWVTTARGSLRL